MSEDGRSKHFATTRWSVVVAAAETGNPVRPAALATLCQTYWGPVYAYLRRRGFDADRAQDLTQGLFLEILGRSFFKDARPERGRFRSFLLSAVKYYLSHERDRAATQKRGGDQFVLPFDISEAESLYQAEATDEANPEKIFEKRWAQALLDKTLARLREEAGHAAHPERSLRLLSLLTPGSGGSSYRDVADELSMSEGAVKVAVHRTRKRFGELLRQEVAHTVQDPGRVDEEMRYLFSVIDS